MCIDSDANTGITVASDPEPQIQVKMNQKMSLMEKLGILSDAAKYDVSCSSSGVSRRGDGTGIGNTLKAGHLPQLWGGRKVYFPSQGSFYQ